MLTAAVPFGPSTVAAQLAAMPPSRVAEVLENAQALAEDQDRLKQRGLYADMDRSGRVRLPSEVTRADVAAQLGRARRAISAASVLFGPGAPAFLTDPPAKSDRTLPGAGQRVRLGEGRPDSRGGSRRVSERDQEGSGAVGSVRCQGAVGPRRAWHVIDGQFPVR
jgi:hypothetical protein